jgi:hypothetical protein
MGQPGTAIIAALGLSGEVFVMVALAAALVVPLHQTLKGDALRPASPATGEKARRIIARFVDHYNRVRLQSALGYVAPLAFVAGQAPVIWAERDRKLEQQQVEYVVAMASNRRLEKRAGRSVSKARMFSKATGETACS